MKKNIILIVVCLLVTGYFIYVRERERIENIKYREEVTKEIESVRDSLKIATDDIILKKDSIIKLNESLEIQKGKVIVKYKYREKYINSINDADSLRVLLSNRYSIK